MTKHITKARFMRIYSRKSPAEKANLKAYYREAFRRAIFAESMMEIERRFEWMREADDANRDLSDIVSRFK